MENVKFYLRKKDKNGSFTIFVYVNVNSKQVYVSTGEKIKEADWSKAKQKAKNNDQLNEVLSCYAVAAEKFVCQCQPDYIYTNDEFKRFIIKNLVIAVSKKETPSTEKEDDKPVIKQRKSHFFNVIDQFIVDAPNRLNSNGERINEKRVEMYVYEKKALQAFERQYHQQLSFEGFDKQMITDFQTFLTNKKRLANNTIVRYIRMLFVFLRYADDTLNLPVNQAFRKYKTHTNKKDSVVLNDQEINQIWNYQPVNDCEANTKKMFLIGLHTGLRFSDYSQLNTNSINFNEMTISLIQTKTGQRVTLPLHPRLANMLKNEKMPRTITNQKFNKYVKELMKKIGFNQVVEIKRIVGGKRIVEYKEKWELISSHTARRSFATNLYKQGVNPSVIMLCTGHRDLDSFMKYIVLDDNDKLQVVRNLWNSAAV